MKERVWAATSVFLTCLFLPLFIYLNNIGNIHFYECIRVFIVSLLIGIVCILLSSLITKSFMKGCVISIVICVCFFNYAIIEQFIERFNQNLKFWHILPCLLFFGIIVFKIFIKKCSMAMLENVTLVVTLVVGGLILLNIATSIPKIISMVSTSGNDRHMPAPINVSENNDDIHDKPNIYYFIFDEYSNFDVLETYFQYDNYVFAEFLEAHKFTVSYDSNNDSQQTYTVISNYINLDYVAFDTDTTNARLEMLKTNVIFDLFREQGYTVEAVVGGNLFGLGEAAPQASTTIEGDNFETLVISNTVFYPFISKNYNDGAMKYNNAFDYFNDAQLFKNAPEATFYMSYFHLPHQPFIFDQYGGEVSLIHSDDWVNKEYYLNQLEYTTTRIQGAVNRIVENDPGAVIILQSDHGARLLRTDAGEYLIDKFDRRKILNAVYYRGEDVSEIKAKSGVNTLRLIINRLFDFDLPEVEVPVSEHEW